MNSLDPIYTPENTGAAYQLNWAVSLFPHQPLPDQQAWDQPLRETLENEDAIRILELRMPSSNVLQVLASTQPQTSPSRLLQRLKGRLQYLVRKERPKAFRRNYRLESVGSAKREVIELYIEQQPRRHPMADPRIQARFDWLQIVADQVDLSEFRYTAHGQFVYNLHVVLEHAEGWCAVEPAFLQRTHDMLQRTCDKKGFLLARAGIVANHLHLAIGCGIDDAPEQVALGLVNNLAYAHAMRAVYRFGYYTGTFCNFDLGALRQAHQANAMADGVGQEAETGSL
jgi:REP element-mobilizing transposase RayT